MTRVVFTRALADTSLFIARESGRELDVSAIPDELAVSVVTVAELRAGVLVAGDLESRDRRLATLQTVLDLDAVPVDREVADAWAKLRVYLRDFGRRMPVNDSWIAATAMVLDVPVVTQDDDYDGVPGIDVLKV